MKKKLIKFNIYTFMRCSVNSHNTNISEESKGYLPSNNKISFIPDEIDSMECE